MFHQRCLQSCLIMLLAVYLFDTRADHHHQKYKIKTVFCASDAQKTVFILYFFKCFKNAISYKNKCKELPHYLKTSLYQYQSCHDCDVCLSLKMFTVHHVYTVVVVFWWDVWKNNILNKRIGAVWVKYYNCCSVTTWIRPCYEYITWLKW